MPDLNDLIPVNIRVNRGAENELRRQANAGRVAWSRIEHFRSTDAGKAEALGIWQFWTAVLAALDDHEQSRGA